MMPLMVVSSRVTTRQPMRYWFIARPASSTLAVSAIGWTWGVVFPTRTSWTVDMADLLAGRLRWAGDRAGRGDATGRKPGVPEEAGLCRLEMSSTHRPLPSRSLYWGSRSRCVVQEARVFG